MIKDKLLKEIYELVCITDMESYQDFKEWVRFQTIDSIIEEVMQYIDEENPDPWVVGIYEDLLNSKKGKVL